MGYSKSMTTNIYKVLICCFLLIGNFVKGQELINVTSTLNLVSGEQIYDIAYEPHNKKYYVVGDFTFVTDSATYNNFIVLDEELEIDITLSPSIESIDGIISSVEVYRFYSPFTSSHIVNIYIGGYFTELTMGSTTYLRNGMCMFTINEGAAFSSLIFNAWDPQIDMPVINSIKIEEGYLAISGGFFYVNDYLDERSGLAVFNPVSGMLLPDFYPSSLTSSYDFSIYSDLKIIEDTIYIVRNNGISKVAMDGTTINSYFGTYDGSFVLASINDSLILLGGNYTGAGSEGINFISPINRKSLNITTIPGFSGTAASAESIVIYQNSYYSLNWNIIEKRILQESPLFSFTPTSWSTSLLPSPFPKDDYSGINNKSNLIVAGNKLFVTGTDMTTASGYPRIGWAAYCLEPQNAQPFTDFDLDVCPLDTFTYTIPPSDFADGYLWEFSGTGVSLGATGAPELLSYDATSVTGNSIQIAFGIGFSPGNLTVTPYSNCGGNLVDPSNVQYAQPQTIYIDTNPLPNVYAGLDTTLTCRRTSVLLEGFSSTPGVTYEWIQPGPYNTVGTDTIATTDGEYVFQVTDALGCPNFDTVIVSLDTIKPDVILPLGPFSITCSDTVRNLLGSTSTTDSLLFWRKVSSMDSLPNPAFANGLGEYRLIVEDTINGCRDSAAVFMYLDQTPPNIRVSGYPDLAAGGYLDTLDCYFPNLLLNAYSDSINAVINWCDEDSTNFVGTDTLIENGGWFYIFAEDTVKGCTNYGKVLIFEDFGQPDVSINPTTALNCSNDSLILNATTLVGDSLIWTGSLIPSSSNPLIVFDPGWYSITAIDSLNGCSRLDSIEIIADNSIDVIAGNDTIACNQELIPFSASYIGSISGITYAWNNGSTDALSFYTAGLDSIIVVEVNGDGGCYGSDTVRMDIPPIPIIEFTGYQPCGDGATGQIVGDPLSGLAPFNYSIDGGITYQTTPVFTGLGFGTYPIWVKDSLSCDYEFEAIIDQSSALPEPEFLFSTYNFATDTVVIIDVSNPPTDSTVWEFPTELMVLDSNDLSPMLLLPDTGSFEIIMHAWYGTCEVITSKLIYASPFDSSSASFYNQNGIKSIELYPNPTTGEFTVNIEFYKSQRAAISLQDMLGYSYVFYSYDETAFISELITMDAAALNGTYILKVVSEFDSAAITFILSR